MLDRKIYTCYHEHVSRYYTQRGQNMAINTNYMAELLFDLLLDVATTSKECDVIFNNYQLEQAQIEQHNFI